MRVNKFAERLTRVYHRLTVKTQPINFLSSVDDYINVLLTSNIDPRSHNYIKRFTIIKPYSSDINSFYLPKRSFINRVAAQGISVCIDLDFNPNFFNSSVCIMTKAPVRIGFAKGLGLPYYNLEIDIDSDKVSTKESYNQFIKVLYNFKNEGEEIAPIKT
ncbi:MAG: hypothetical protein B6D58_00205 [candidate division Zixibacteria bacterium 4484_95]|nr:MAG: hypothetical protein B6D58_00205 [candidate division Zixibacteria bacterium 4484_95]